MTKHDASLSAVSSATSASAAAAPATATAAASRTVTSGPISPAHHRGYVAGSREDLRVPVRTVHLTDGNTVRLYDTSGPYTDPAFDVDVRRGLPALRTAWIDERGDTERYDGRIGA